MSPWFPVAQLIFWTFVAVVVVVGAWREVALRREAEKTIRLAIERGQQLSPALIAQMLGPVKDKPLSRAVTLLALGIGLPIIGFLFRLNGNDDGDDFMYLLFGVGVLLFVLGAAQLAVWRLTARDANSNPAD